MGRFIAAVSFASLLAGCSSATSIEGSERQVGRFHKMLDAGQLQAIYQGSAVDMKNATSAPQFIALLSAIHRKLGTVREAKLQGFNVNYGTGGGFVTLSYETNFEGGAAGEQFVFRLSSGEPQLAGYHINSDALILK